MLVNICAITNAQYIRHGNKYVQESKKHCAYNGMIEDQFYYRDRNHTFLIGIIFKSYARVSALDSIKVVGSVKRGKEDGLISFHLIDGRQIATAEMKSGRINGIVTVFLEDHKIELYARNRRIINPLRNRRNCANRNGHT